MDTQSVVQLFILIILLALSAFFSSAETSLTTVSRIRVRNLVEENNKRAITLQKIIDRSGKMLSTILIGNNIANITASALATTFAIRVFGSYAVGMATGILTILVLLFGEIVPKTWATLNSEKLALTYAPIVYTLMIVFTPVIKIIDLVSFALFRLLHIDPNAKGGSMTESELKTIVDVSHEDGIIESEEREMIYNVFEFGDSCAKDIMIPRIDMTTLNLTASFSEVIATFQESMYTRIPVYENDISNIIGLINMKDILLVAHQEDFQIKNILRTAHYTYEYKKTADLLVEMRSNNASVSFVLNEYGATVGLITLEDLLEEIVGEIRDEYDEYEEDFLKEVNEREYVIAGSMKLDDINDALHTCFFSEDYDSIGGIMIEFLDRLPVEGEVVTTEDGIRLTAEKVNQNRIEWVHMELPETKDEEEELKEDSSSPIDAKPQNTEES